MIRVDFDETAILSALQNLTAVLGDLAPIMQDIAEYGVVSTKERFTSGTAPDGAAWAPNSPVTLARKKGTRPLIGETGLLAAQIFHSSTADTAIWGSDRIQAAVMQFGAAQGEFGASIGKDKKGRDHFHHLPWGDIPARPFIGLSDDDQTNILDIISDALAAALTP